MRMTRWLLALGFVLLTVTAGEPAPGGAVKIAAEGADFVISGSAYQARINGKTGLLEQMTIGGVTVIEKTRIDLENRPIAKIAVVQEGPSKVVTYVTAQEKNTPVDKALRISYEAQPDLLYIKTLSTVGHVSGRGMGFEIGKEAQMVRSLEFKETIPMPVLQGRTPWLLVKYHFSNGATLGLLNSGAGNPYNPNENGGVGGWQYSRGGYVANSEYVYTLIPERGNVEPGKKLLGAPAMTIVEAKTPGVFFQGERTAPGSAGVPPAHENAGETPALPVTLRIAKKDFEKLAGVPGLRVKYEVQDVFEKEAAKGEAPLDLAHAADPLELKITLPIKKLGWYRAYFTVNDAAGSLLEGKERFIFALVQHLPGMGESFANQMQTDYTIGLGLYRESIQGMNVNQLEKAMAERAEQVKGTDVNVSFQIDGPPPGVGNNPQKFGQYCLDLFTRVKEKVPRVEIINEPNGTLQPKEYIDTFLRPAFENIRKASPETRIVAPVLCGISADQARYLQDLYKLGLKDLTDELSFHPYAGNFDDGSAVEAMQRLMQVITANGDGAKPIHFTEAGYGHGGWSDLASLRETIKYLISQYAWQNAVMGIDHRHNFYYFTDQMGYLDFWLRSVQLTPAAVAMRTYTGLVKGQGRARKLDFGSLESVRAFLYPGPEKQVVALWTGSNRDQETSTAIAFETDAPSGSAGVPAGTETGATLQLLDTFGNPLPCKVENGKLAVSAGTFPMYLVLPAKARLAPVPENWGTNLALASLGAVAESTSEEGTRPAVGAIDGNTASESSWRSLTPNELPQSLTVTLAGPAQIDRAGLWSYSARGYDLEALGADGKWVKLVSRRDQPWRRFRAETFPPLVTDQVRLTIVDSYSDRAEVAELQIFSPGAAVGKALDLVNWALKSNGAIATASSEMVKDITVAEQDWGAKQPRISKLKLEAKAENAIDGKRLIKDWREFFPTTWMAAPGAPLPQWLEIKFDGPKTITSVAVYTIAFATWTPADSGVRDWDVQAWDGKDWKTLDSVTGNTRVSKISRFKPPLTTEKIRVVVKATNDPEGTVGLMEVQAFGPG